MPSILAAWIWKRLECGLKSVGKKPITKNAMAPFPFRVGFFHCVLAAACLASADTVKKKKPALSGDSAPKKESITTTAPAAFEELNFSRTLVIEGKVEKPQVQFALLKEPPPEKEIRFETSFLQNILKLDRENTFRAGETNGRD